MISSFPATRITERTILRSMIVGFALVLLLLGLAGLAAVRGTRSIEVNTAQVVREQLLAARLLNEVQAEEDALTGVLHQLTLKPESLDRPAVLQRLDEADRAVERIITVANATSEARVWQQLGRKIRSFSADARRLVRSGSATREAEIDGLFATHNEVVKLVNRLLASSSARVSTAERSIEAESQELAKESSALLGACFALALVCALLTIIFSRRSLGQMRWQANELNKVSWHMLQTQEAAARRFSHELHDELGQSLAAVKANLVSANPAEFATRRLDCLHLVDEAIANVRELSQLLRPVILDDFGLEAGLRWLTDKFAQRTGLAVTFHSTVQRRLADETETHLFRIAQEALTNIARHSGASGVDVRLQEAGDKIWLRIEDNGRGFDQEVITRSSVGLTGMRARATQAGGELIIDAPPGRGARIEVWVPAGEITHVEQEDAHSVS